MKLNLAKPLAKHLFALSQSSTSAVRAVLACIPVAMPNLLGLIAAAVTCAFATQLFAQQSESAAFIAEHPVLRYAADPSFAPIDFVANGRHSGLAKD